MPRGRRKLPEGEHLVSVSVRLPMWLIKEYDAMGGDRSKHIRRVLEDYIQEVT